MREKERKRKNMREKTKSAVCRVDLVVALIASLAWGACGEAGDSNEDPAANAQDNVAKDSRQLQAAAGEAGAGVEGASANTQDNVSAQAVNALPFATCGASYGPITVGGGGMIRGASRYTISCKTLAGNVTAYTVKGYVEDWYDDGWGVRLEAVVDGSSEYVYAKDGFGTQYFTISKTGTGGVRVYTSTSILYP